MTVIDRPDTDTGGSGDQFPTSKKPETSKDGMLFFIAAAALAIVLVLGLVAIAAVALFRDDDGGGSGAAGPASVSSLDVELTEFAIEGELAATEGNVVLNVVNAGALEHNLAVTELGVQTRNLQSRGADTLDLGELAPGTYEVYCTISGHKESGMVNELVVYAEGEEQVVVESELEDLSAEELDRLMVESMMKYPAETEGVGNRVLEPEILADGTKHFALTAEVIKWEVAPGEIVDAWAYNGMVPGPRIHLDVGDKAQFELTNLTPLGTDIHWHGVDTPNDQDGVSPYTQEPIETGETFTYEFTAEAPAIGMYHAHLHSQTSVVNGMFAMIQIGDNPLPLGQTVSGVEIPADLEPVFEEPMVLNDAGTIGLSLNGKSFPATAPIVMTEGDWGVIHYYNEGLTAHPMHLHEFNQLVYAKDGIPLEQPYWADTINVAPGERYSILFQAEKVGTWVYHCHILTHVERADGMFGMVTAVVVQPKEGA